MEILLQEGFLNKERNAPRGVQLYPVVRVHGVDRNGGPGARIRPRVAGNTVQGQVQQQLAPKETPPTAAPTLGSKAPACRGDEWLYRSTGKLEDSFKVTVGGGLPQHVAGNPALQKPDFKLPM